MERSNKCGEIGSGNIGQAVAVCGWVANRRDLGGVIFLDIRDRWGLVQAVFDPKSSGYAAADQVRKEYVVQVAGRVEARENPNPALATGEVEIVGDKLTILNTATLPPFYITDDVQVDENLRLRHRYLDLRRPVMQNNLMLRSRTAAIFRRFLAERDFVEVDTPILTRSTPEGARDYLVPSRISPGEFYALPQSPQLFKQLLMVAGLERYYQIARCFRDEDLRADRQPEFTQVDIEASFMTQASFMMLMEELTARIYKEIRDVELDIPFPRLKWTEAMARYGSDRPDLRFAMEITDLSQRVAGGGFRVFADAVAQGGSVRGIKVRAEFSRKELERLAEVVAPHGAKGLAWMVVEHEGVRSPVAKFFAPDQIDAIVSAFAAQPGNILLFVADANTYGVVLPALGALRLHLGRQLKLYETGDFKPCWVTDFPLLEYDEAEGRYIAAHHPFTAPVAEDMDKLDTDPANVRAQAYDLVINGVEIAGGSVRNHSAATQLQVLKAVGFSEEEARKRFGFLLQALEFGAPPHGGIAFGFDRLVAQLAGAESVRQVIPFPKTNSAADLMMDAPAAVDRAQLEELDLERKKQ